MPTPTSWAAGDAIWRRVDSSHGVMMRHPEATVRYILRADARN